MEKPLIIYCAKYVYSWLERVYGTKLDMGQSPCLQNYGSVETRQDRLLAFPNVLLVITPWTCAHITLYVPH